MRLLSCPLVEEGAADGGPRSVLEDLDPPADLRPERAAGYNNVR
jgi:hypothetical protein